METAVMTQLQATVLQRSSCLYKMLLLFAELDCLMSLAQASQDYGYCAPSYSERCILNLQHARYTAAPPRWGKGHCCSTPAITTEPSIIHLYFPAHH